MAFFNKKKQTEESPGCSYDKEIEKNKIIVFLIPNETYQTELLRITKNVAEVCNRVDKTLYISLNKPAEKIRKTLEENNINTKKFVFVDAVMKKVKLNVTDHGTLFISPPKYFDKFNSELNQIIEKEKAKCLIFDSLSTMLIYQDAITITKFIHDLVTKLIMNDACGEFMCLSEDVDSALIKDVSMFVDKVIDLRGKREETEKKGDWKKKENEI